MDKNALFQIQCGLFVAAVGVADKMNGCITNTLMQQSHAPVKVSLTIQKANYTHDMIMEKKTIGVSALSKQASTELIQRFGFQSGRDVDKFAGFTEYILNANGDPLLTGEMIAATFSLKVYDMVDMDSHTMFLCTVEDAAANNGAPITYADYRASKKREKKTEEKTKMTRYVCSICGYVYDPEVGDPDNGIAPGTPFEDLPDDFVCPACGVGKDMFEAE